MASRISSSFWAPLPSGILPARDMDDYRLLASALGRAKRRLSAVRGALREAKRGSPLFNTDQWVKRLERGLGMMLEGEGYADGGRGGFVVAW